MTDWPGMQYKWTGSGVTFDACIVSSGNTKNLEKYNRQMTVCVWKIGYVHSQNTYIFLSYKKIGVHPINSM